MHMLNIKIVCFSRLPSMLIVLADRSLLRLLNCHQLQIFVHGAE